MPHRNRQRLFLDCELLERRQLLAGTVTITTNSAGDVTVRGDGEANWISLQATVDGDLHVLGANTTVRYNGVSAASQLIPLDESFQLARHLRVRSGGGDDIINVEGLDVAGMVDAVLSGGNDTLGLTNLRVDGDVRLRGSGGADRFDLFAVQVAGNAALSLNSQVIPRHGTPLDLDGISVVSTVVSGELKLFGSSQDDSIIVESSVVEGKVDVRASASNDVVIFYDNTLLGETLVDMGRGDDTVDLESTALLSTSRFQLGSGDDLVNFFVAVTHHADVTILGGAGADAVLGIMPVAIGTANVSYDSIELNPFV